MSNLMLYGRISPARFLERVNFVPGPEGRHALFHQRRRKERKIDEGHRKLRGK